MLAEALAGLEQELVHGIAFEYRGLQSVDEGLLVEIAQGSADDVLIFSSLAAQGGRQPPGAWRKIVGQLQAQLPFPVVQVLSLDARRAYPLPGEPLLDGPGRAQLAIRVHHHALAGAQHMIQGKQPVLAGGFHGDFVGNRRAFRLEGCSGYMGFAPGPVPAIGVPEHHAPPVTLGRRWHIAVEAHPEGHFFGLAEVTDAAHADAVGHPGDAATIKTEGPEGTVQAGKKDEQHQHHGYGGDHHAQGFSAQQLQGQLLFRQVVGHKQGGKARGHEQHISRQCRGLLEQKQGDQDEVSQEDKNVQIPPGSHFQQLQARHEHQQGHAELAAFAEIGLVDHQHHADAQQQGHERGRRGAFRAGPEQQAQQHEQGKAAADGKGQVPGMRQGRQGHEQAAGAKQGGGQRAQHQHVFHGDSPCRARASRHFRRWASPLSGAIFRPGRRRP